MGQFYDMLIFLRKRAGLSQQQLADALKITRSAIGMYETGKREPDLETLEAIADFFNVDMDTLTGRENPPTGSGVHTINDDDIKFALFGGDSEITDAMYDEVKRFAAYVRQREADGKK